MVLQVNNVGTNIRKDTTAYSAEDFHRLITTNLESAYHLSQLAQPLLAAAAAAATEDASSGEPREGPGAAGKGSAGERTPGTGNASIVFNSSVAGLVAIRSGSIYAMTKGTAVQLCCR